MQHCRPAGNASSVDAPVLAAGPAAARTCMVVSSTRLACSLSMLAYCELLRYGCGEHPDGGSGLPFHIQHAFAQRAVGKSGSRIAGIQKRRTESPGPAQDALRSSDEPGRLSALKSGAWHASDFDIKESAPA